MSSNEYELDTVPLRAVIVTDAVVGNVVGLAENSYAPAIPCTGGMYPIVWTNFAVTPAGRPLTEKVTAAG